MIIKSLTLFCLLVMIVTICSTIPNSETFDTTTETVTKSTEVLDNEDEDSNENCDSITNLPTFIREYNFSFNFLPDDFDQLDDQLNNEKIDIYKQIRHINDSFVVYERLVNYVEKLQTSREILETIKYLASLMMDKVLEAKISAQCQADLVQVVNGVKRHELWAMSFLDSFGSLPSGILRGVLSSFGDFDQCLSIKSPQIFSTPDHQHIYGKYCQISLRQFLPPLEQYDPSFESLFKRHSSLKSLLHLMETGGAAHFLLNGRTKVVKSIMETLDKSDNNMLFVGVCFPSSCEPNDIERLFNRLVYPILKTPVSVMERTCDVHPEVKNTKWNNFQWTAIICIAILAFIVSLSSLYHFALDNFEWFSKSLDPNNNTRNRPKRTVIQQFILSFSALQNTEKLLRVDDRFGVVDTIRLILTFSVYSVQSFDFVLIMTPSLLRDMFYTGPGEIHSSSAYWFTRLPGIWIDGFMFTLGMMLIGAQFSRLKRDGGSFDYLMYAWKRWYRLSIAMVGTIFAMYLLPLTGDGPLWFVNDQWLVPACKDPYSLLSSFLYYSNFNAIRGDYEIRRSFPICNVPTWFLSMSTQLYLLSPLIFLPLYSKPRLGLILLSTVIILSAFSTAAPYLLFDIPTYASPTHFNSLKHGIQSFVHYHTYPYQYVTSMSVGMLTGYLIKRHPTVRIIGGRVAEIVLWFGCTVMIVSIFVWHNSFWNEGQDNSVWSTLSWFICSKFMLSSALGYICYMCCTGRAKTINRLLTVPSLQPLAKLSYGIFLLRVPTIFHRITTPRNTYTMKFSLMWQNIFIDFLITSILAYVLYLLFEAPSTNIMKIFEQNEFLFFTKQSEQFKNGGSKTKDNEIVDKNENAKDGEEMQMEISNGEINKAFSFVHISNDEHESNK